MPSLLSRHFARHHARLAAQLDEARRDPACFDQVAYDAFRASLLHHMGLEERLLFPALERTGGEDIARRLHATHIEHMAIASLLSLTPDADLADELACLLSAHDRAEESVDGIHALVDALPAQLAQSLLDEIRHAVRHDPPTYADSPGAPRTAQAALAAVLLKAPTS